MISRSSLAPFALLARLRLRLRVWLRGLTRRQAALRGQLRNLVLIALLPALAVTLADGVVATKQAEQMIHSHAGDGLRLLAADIESELARDIRGMNAIIVRLEMGGADQKRLLEEANDWLDGHFCILAVDAATPPECPSWHETIPPANLTHLRKRAEEQHEAVIGELVYTTQSAIPIVPILLVEPTHTGPNITLLFQIEASRFSTRLRKHSMSDDTVVSLVDTQGDVISTTPELPPAPDLPVLAQTPLRLAKNWRLVVTSSTNAVTLSFYQPLLRAILAAGLALLLGVLLSNWGSLKLTQWLQQLSQMSHSVASSGEWMQPPPEHFPITEFEELRRNLARAVAMLRRRGAAERMALREARTGHELLISVVNGTPEEIHVKDLDLRYVMVNRAALNNGPERRAEWQVLGKQTADLFPPELASHIEDADRRVLATGEATSFELDYLTPGDTSPRWLAMTIAPWQDVEGKVVGVVSVSRDVTPHRQAQVRLRKLQAELLRATRLSAMGAMASGLAHELNQPLAAATNYLNAGNRLLERSADGDTNALQAARGAVTDAAQQMLRAGAIVRRLRDFVDRGEVELQPESVEELLRETTDLAISDGLPENIGLELTVADNIGHVLVDRTQIGQVVLNLLRNAAEAIQSMEPPRQGLIRVSARLISSNMVITVQDNGPGLAPGIADRLFEPFVSSKRTGMGIGLAICRTIVEGHGGRLTAEMLPEGGMMFRIVLPVMMPQGEIG